MVSVQSHIGSVPVQKITPETSVALAQELACQSLPQGRALSLCALILNMACVDAMVPAGVFPEACFLLPQSKEPILTFLHLIGAGCFAKEARGHHLCRESLPGFEPSVFGTPCTGRFSCLLPMGEDYFVLFGAQ